MMKKILLIATGGTIACRPSENGALAPALSVKEILECVPELSGVADIDKFQLFDLDSTNIGPSEWTALASVIRDNYDGYDGFVGKRQAHTVHFKQLFVLFDQGVLRLG